MTKKIAITAAVFAFALLTVTAPAHAAPIAWYQIDSLNLTYPGNTTLTGDLTIEDGAPSVAPYEFSGGSFSLNGVPLQVITGGSGYIYTVGPQITFPVPAYNSPSAPNPYGEAPLYLSPTSIFLNGTPGIGGTVSTDFCTLDGTSGNSSCTNLGTVSAVPLPAALPLFGSALLILARLAWRRGKVSA